MIDFRKNTKYILKYEYIFCDEYKIHPGEGTSTVALREFMHKINPYNHIFPLHGKAFLILAQS